MFDMWYLFPSQIFGQNQKRQSIFKKQPEYEIL